MAISTAYASVFITIGTIVASLAVWWSIASTRLAVGFLFVSLIAGQLVRIPLPGQGGGVLVSDLAVVLVLISALAYAIQDHVARNYELRITNYGLLVSPFILWSLFTLVIRMPELGLIASLIAASYWLRLSAYLLLLPALMLLFQDIHLLKFAQRWFIGAVIVLVLLGFLQIWLVPDLRTLSTVVPASLAGLLGEGGWDPHVGRLVSTWLDPNFFGLFLVLALLYMAARGITITSKKVYRFLPSFFFFPFSFPLFLTLLALILTQSRSSMGALLLSFLVLSPLLVYRGLLKGDGVKKVVQAASIVGLVVAVGLVAWVWLGERAYGVLQMDETIRLRLESLHQVWASLAQDHALVGVGYNAYQFAAHKEGLIRSFTIHSRAGADSSLLTLWVTTGIPGVVLFMLPWAYAASSCVRRWILRAHAPSIAAAIGVTTAFTHSFVVNSFLYAHVLVALIVIVAFAYGDYLSGGRVEPKSP